MHKILSVQGSVFQPFAEFAEPFKFIECLTEPKYSL